MRIAIGCDHAGYNLKEQLKISLIEQGYEIEDIGCQNGIRCDYPNISQPAARD